MTPVLSLSLALALGGVPAAAGAPGPVSSLRGLWPALTACFQAPDGSAGSEITVRFSLDRSGAVQGKPKVTFSRLVGTPAQKQAFVEAALGALQRCTPVHVTGGLGGAIAGRPLTVRFSGGGPSQAI